MKPDLCLWLCLLYHTPSRVPGALFFVYLMISIEFFWCGILVNVLDLSLCASLDMDLNLWTLKPDLVSWSLILAFHFGVIFWLQFSFLEAECPSPPSSPQQINVSTLRYNFFSILSALQAWSLSWFFSVCPIFLLLKIPLIYLKVSFCKAAFRKARHLECKSRIE